MRDYFDTDNSRHNTHREQFRARKNLVDVSVDPVTGDYYKIVASAAHNLRDGVVYLSLSIKSQLDYCVTNGRRVYLVIDDKEYVYSPLGWDKWGGDHSRTPRYRTLLSKLEKKHDHSDTRNVG